MQSRHKGKAGCGLANQLTESLSIGLRGWIIYIPPSRPANPGSNGDREGRSRFPPPPPRAEPAAAGLMIPGAPMLLGHGGAARQRERRKESKESCGEQNGGPPRTESSRRWASPRSPRQPAGGSRHLAAGFGIFSRTLCAGSTSQLAGERGAVGFESAGPPGADALCRMPAWLATPHMEIAVQAWLWSDLPSASPGEPRT